MLAPLIRSLRPAQWVKNLFVLAPLVFARALEVPDLLGRSLLAFFSFCAISSAVYLVNDLRDLEKDRLHPLKRQRPLASGELSPGVALVAAAGLVVVSVLLGLPLGIEFLAVVAAYFVLNLGYTFQFKRWVIVDVMTISFCYVLRVLAGSVAIDVQVSAWLLLCTVFLALFLAFSKRRHELVLLESSAADQREVLGQYSPFFLDQMINVVTASTLIAYVLYTMDPKTVAKFGTEALVITVPFVLFGIFRYLYLIYQVTDPLNPTEAMLRDLPFVINLGLWTATVFAVLYLA